MLAVQGEEQTIWGDVRQRSDRVPRWFVSLDGESSTGKLIGHGGGGPVATAALLRQLANTTKAIHDAHIAAGDHRRAAEIEAVVRGQVEQVRRALPKPATSGAQAGEPLPPVRCRPMRISRIQGEPRRVRMLHRRDDVGG